MSEDVGCVVIVDFFCIFNFDVIDCIVFVEFGGVE